MVRFYIRVVETLVNKVEVPLYFGELPSGDVNGPGAPEKRHGRHRGIQQAFRLWNKQQWLRFKSTLNKCCGYHCIRYIDSLEAVGIV